MSPSSAVGGEPELECVAVCVGEGASVGSLGRDWGWMSYQPPIATSAI